MSAANFPRKQGAKRYYVLHNEELEFVDDTIEFIRQELGNMFGGFGHTTGLLTVETNRSYPSMPIGVVTSHKLYGDDNEVVVTVEVFLSSGYYSGAIIDYKTSIEVNGYEVEYPNDIEYRHFLPMNNGLAKMFSMYARSWTKNEIDEITTDLENVLSDLTEPYSKIAQFSNGEAVYSKV